MSVLISAVIFLLLIFALMVLYAKVKLSFKHQSLALLLVSISTIVFDLVSSFISIPLLIISSVFFVLGFVPSVRKKWVSQKLLRYIGKALPPISDTEQAAIDAGTVWWEAELFRGNPNWDKLHNVPEATLTEEELAFLNGPVNEFCALLDDWKISNVDKDLTPEAWSFIKKHKLFGLIIPKEYGGLGFSPLANSEIVMKIASRSGSAGVTVMVPNSLGPGELLVEHGTQKQKDYYLPRLANGDDIPCFALTGPWAGSDAGAMMDSGIVCYQEINGEKVLGFRTSWKKRYITLAPVATIIGLAFKAYDPDGLLGDKKDLGITCALVPANTPGVKIGNRHLPLSATFMNGPTEATDVFIPMEWIIGEQEGIGIGWQMLMDSLAAGRAISLPASGVAISKVSSWTSGAYANIREQFNLPIGKFEAIEEVLARMAAKTYMMDATRLFTLAGLMQGEKPSVVSAIVKYHLTEGGREVMNDAMDIHGGKGICMGPSNYLASGYQMLPIAITVEGANIITRSLIIFGQGAMRCHPYLLDEINLASSTETDEVIDKFDKTLSQHIAYVLANKARSFVYGVTRGRLANVPESCDMKRYYQQLSRLSAGFAFLADTALLVLGGEFKRKEKISSRFADVLSEMYMISALLKRYRDLNCNEEEKAIIEWSCQYALHKGEKALYDITKNFPVKIVGSIMRYIIFPTGRYCQLPQDELGEKVAATILMPGDVRDTITAGIYVDKNNPDDILGSVDIALNLAISTRKLRRQLRKDGLEQEAYQSFEEWTQSLLMNEKINQAQHDELNAYYVAIYKIISVDDFHKSDV